MAGLAPPGSTVGCTIDHLVLVGTPCHVNQKPEATKGSDNTVINRHKPGIAIKTCAPKNLKAAMERENWDDWFYAMMIELKGLRAYASCRDYGHDCREHAGPCSTMEQTKRVHTKNKLGAPW